MQCFSKSDQIFLLILWYKSSTTPAPAVVKLFAGVWGHASDDVMHLYVISYVIYLIRPNIGINNNNYMEIAVFLLMGWFAVTGRL